MTKGRDRKIIDSSNVILERYQRLTELCFGFRFNKVGYYTQLAWADTYKIGCGFSKFPYTGGKIMRSHVCFYGPTGNKNGGRVYEAGEPCTQCPGGTTCKNSLCSEASPGIINTVLNIS